MFEGAGERAFTLIIIITIFFLIYVKYANTTMRDTLKKIVEYFKG